MAHLKMEQDLQVKVRFLEREVVLWQAAVIVVASLLVAGMALTAIGQQHFWRPVFTTRQERGLAYYQALVDREPGKPEHWVDLGWYYYQGGDFATALKKHLHALELNPEHFGALLNAGLTSVQLFEYSSAVNYLEQAVQINENYWEAYLALGAAYIGLEKWEAAERALLDSLDIHRFSADTYFYLGYVAERQDRLDDAREFYQGALRFDPYYAEAQKGLSRVNGDRE